MSIKKYTAFLKIVELGSVTKAANALSQTQSSVTQLLNSLESELNLSLLIRNRSGVILTDAGKEVLPLIKKVIDADNELKNTAIKIANRDQKTIRIGTFTSVAVNWLPTIIKEFQEKVPDVRIELADGGYDDILTRLSDHRIDLGFITLPITSDCKCIPLYEDRLLAVLPKDHPLCHKKSLPVSYFQTEPTISLMEDTDWDARKVLEASNIIPNIKFRTKDDYAMIAMAENNLGICIVPELLLKGTKHRVHTMELDPPAKRIIGIAIPEYEKASETVLSFADFITEWVKNHSLA